MVEIYQLRQKQSLPLDAKENLGLESIFQFRKYYGGDVICNISGGVDSIVLLHMCRRVDPKMKAGFSDTGLEHKGVREHALATENLCVTGPDLPHHLVLDRFGYPVISKLVSRYVEDIRNNYGSDTANLRLTGIKSDGTPGSKASMLSKCWYYLINAPFKVSAKCCYYLKIAPLVKLQKETGCYPIVGTLAEDSVSRERTYLKTGCNVYGKTPKCIPLSPWTRQDVMQYILKYDLAYPPEYGDLVLENGIWRFTGEQHTGCQFCMFGIMNDPKRFIRLQRQDEKRHNYCINRLGMGKVLDYIGIKYAA